jgi:hypothetical protein
MNGVLGKNIATVPFVLSLSKHGIGFSGQALRAKNF